MQLGPTPKHIALARPFLLIILINTFFALGSDLPKKSDAFEGQSSLCKKLEVNASHVDQSPNTSDNPANSARNIVDGNLTSAWSNKAIPGEWVEIDLGNLKSVCYIDISWTKGVRRVNDFAIFVSMHNDSSVGNREDILWQKGNSMGRLIGPTSLQRIEIEDVVARTVKIMVSGNQWNNWTGINELQVYGYDVPNDEKFLITVMRSHVQDQQILVDLYSQHLKSPLDLSLSKPDDSNLGYTMQLPGQHGVSYFSLQEIRENAERLKKAGLDAIEYNLEENYSPKSDLRSPVQSVQQAYDLAHKNGLKLILTPSMDLTNKHVIEFARNTDYYNIMALEHQTPNSTSAFRDHVTDTVAKIRKQSPDLPITVELTTVRGTLESMKFNFVAVFHIVDGYSIWYSNDAQGLARLERFLEWSDSARS